MNWIALSSDWFRLASLPSEFQFCFWLINFHIRNYCTQPSLHGPDNQGSTVCLSTSHLVDIGIWGLVFVIHPSPWKILDLSSFCLSGFLQFLLRKRLSQQCRSKGSISGGARKCWRREPLGGSGGMPPPQKNLKSRGLEMLYVLQELFVIYAYRELFTSYTVLANQCALRV